MVKSSMMEVSQKKRTPLRMAKNGKNIFIVGVFMALFLISMISALDFGIDNFVKVSEDVKTIEIWDSGLFLIGTDTKLATVHLDTDLTQHVDIGYEKVWQMTGSPDVDYTDLFSKFEYYNVKDDMKKIEVEVDIKYQTYKTINQPIRTCIESKDNLTKAVCSIKDNYVQIANGWSDYISKDVLAGDEIVISGWTNTKEGDLIEWIPTIAKERIEVWAMYNATGGTITEDGDFIIHTFTSNGIFNVTEGSGMTNVSILVVAGGGGGGPNYAGAGGGAGGMVYNLSYNISVGEYAVVVGAGGTGGIPLSTHGSNGVNSSFGDLVAEGGGYGGAWVNGEPGGNGGSGGGAGAYGAAGNNQFGNGTSGQGNNGGLGDGSVTPAHGAGGGGGAGAVGANGDGTSGGNGGIGRLINISGTDTYYAGGGGGSTDSSGAHGTGGLGGGGNGSYADADDGTANTGGGGGGSERAGATGNGGAGGSGVVIVRYQVITSNPAIDLIIPADYTNTTIKVDDFTFSLNYSDAGVANSWNNYTFTVWNSSNDAIKERLVINGTPDADCSVLEEDTTFVKIKCTGQDITDGVNYTWNVYGCDNDDYCARANINYTFTIDATAPVVKAISPKGSISSHVFGNNLSLNWSINDTNLDTCWLDYNGVNTTLTCGDNATNFIPVVNKQSLILWANDTFGNKNFNLTSWKYSFVENDATFNNDTYETATETFILNLSTDINVLSISSVLNYNGTEYLSTSSCLETECLLSNTIDISLVETGESELNNFFWEFTIFNGSESIITTSSIREQNVSKIYLEECNATYYTETLNFTVYDEQNLSRISPFSFNGAFDFWLGSGSIKRNNSFSNNVTEMNLCLSQNVTMKIDATIDYDEDINTSIYTNRFYYFDNYAINNITKNINMYLLKSAASTSFILKVQDENLLPVADALIEIYRYYPGENVFRIVQIAKTDDNGKSIGFFVTETVDYKFIIKKNGETLLTTGQQKVIPETSPYTLTFNTGTGLNEPWASQNTITSLNSSLVFDSDTGIVTYTYIDNSSNFTQSRLWVQKTSLTNNSAYVTICNDTSILSSASITCDVGNTSGFYVAGAYLTRTGEGLDRQISFQIEDFFSAVGLLGLFFGWFLILISASLFTFNEVAGIWGMTITIFLINILGLIKFGAVFVSAIIGIAIILTWVMER